MSQTGRRIRGRFATASHLINRNLTPLLIFQRYIVRELIGPVILSILFFTMMLLLRQLFEMAEILLEAKIGWPMVLEILGILAVSLLIVTVPMAALLGVLIGTSRLTSENEILAMRVSGTSLFRVFYPVMVLSFIGAGALFYINSFQVPKFYNKLLDRQTQIEFEILTNLEPGKNHDSFSPQGTELYLYFDKRLERQEGDAPYTLRMEGVALRLEGEVGELTRADIGAGNTNSDAEGVFEKLGEQETLFFARSGKIEGDITDYSFKITLEDGTMMPLNRMWYEVNEPDDTELPLGRQNPDEEKRIQFDSMVKQISPEREIDKEDRIEPRQFTFFELMEKLEAKPEIEFWRDKKRGKINDEWQVYTSLQNEFYQRLSLPFALPAFILLAIPLALQLRPQAKSISFLISILLIIVYYVMITWGNALGSKNSSLALPVYIAPNVLLGGLGLILFWKVESR